MGTLEDYGWSEYVTQAYDLVDRETQRYRDREIFRACAHVWNEDQFKRDLIDASWWESYSWGYDNRESQEAKRLVLVAKGPQCKRCRLFKNEHDG